MATLFCAGTTPQRFDYSWSRVPPPEPIRRSIDYATGSSVGYKSRWKARIVGNNLPRLPLHSSIPSTDIAACSTPRTRAIAHPTRFLIQSSNMCTFVVVCGFTSYVHIFNCSSLALTGVDRRSPRGCPWAEVHARPHWWTAQVTNVRAHGWLVFVHTRAYILAQLVRGHWRSRGARAPLVSRQRG